MSNVRKWLNFLLYKKSTLKNTRVNEENTANKHLLQRIQRKMWRNRLHCSVWNRNSIWKRKGNLWNLKELPKTNAPLSLCQTLLKKLTKTVGKSMNKKTIALWLRDWDLFYSNKLKNNEKRSVNSKQRSFPPSIDPIANGFLFSFTCLIGCHCKFRWKLLWYRKTGQKIE